MTKEPTKESTGAPLTWDDLPDIITVNEGAAALRVTPDLIKDAIRAGRLKAFIPGKRPDKHGKYHSPGRGQQYRMKKSDLADWYFGPAGGAS